MMIGATLVLNVSVNKSEKTSGNIVELEEHTNQMAYMEDVEKFQVKVYSSNAKLTAFVNKRGEENENSNGVNIIDEQVFDRSKIVLFYYGNYAGKPLS